ncbi:DUF3592 domain-containing protein [Kibdelosporangium phytohabitans]|uniref:DUF3592 domain-containing protein n=1 Tax=Kibdelosporangium phytohabitans TaxID=860235 RepID=UPI0019EEF2E0|nr:DUF3592 domain-containing protein [Kibdelosporangium phytohabitans]MBE1467063.1 hypothetical protein [Kibdelosporangium phytohabitans]
MAVGRASVVRRVAAITLVSIGATVTLLAVTLVIGAYREDAGLNARSVRTTAEVLSVTFDRTLVRYQTPDGADHIPPDGVGYPAGLQAGQLVEVEYDAAKPDLVKVAGRGAYLTLMPAGTLVLFLWLIIGPGLWWLRRRYGTLFRRDHPQSLSPATS